MSNQKNEELNIAQNKKDCLDCLFTRKDKCPVCGKEILNTSVKASSIKKIEPDTDLMNNYKIVNPLLYDILICNNCGYAAIASNFKDIPSWKQQILNKLLSPLWKPIDNPLNINVQISIQRYKLALLIAEITNSKLSHKAYLYLKISWLFRIIKDVKNEKIYQKEALEAFKEAFSNEDFPMEGMDKGTLLYLIGELYRRQGNKNKASKWFAKVSVYRGSSKSLKNMALDRKQNLNEFAQNEEDNKPETINIKEKEENIKEKCSDNSTDECIDKIKLEDIDERNCLKIIKSRNVQKALEIIFTNNYSNEDKFNYIDQKEIQGKDNPQAGPSNADSKEILKKCKKKVFSKGQYICKENEVAQEMFIILSGKVNIFKDTNEGSMFKVAQLKVGDFFGEMSMLEGMPRNASAIADETTVVVVLNMDNFGEFITTSPTTTFKILQGLSLRVRKANENMMKVGDICEKALKNPSLIDTNLIIEIIKIIRA